MTNSATPSEPATATIIPMPGLSKKDRRRSEDKWTAQVIRLGYTVVPSLLLRAQAKLGLTPEQLNVLLQLAEHWWEADKEPYPSKETLARRMHKSPRQVQRYLTQLEDAGLSSALSGSSGTRPRQVTPICYAASLRSSRMSSLNSGRP